MIRYLLRIWRFYKLDPQQRRVVTVWRKWVKTQGRPHSAVEQKHLDRLAVPMTPEEEASEVQYAAEANARDLASIGKQEDAVAPFTQADTPKQ